MRKTINNVTLYGRLYTHNLEQKVSQKGVNYIGGTITIATDDANLNTVTVTYVYVAPTYPAKNGKPERPNPNYAVLQRIINDGCTVLKDGADEAWMLKLTPSLAVNDFVSRDGDMVSAPRLEGGFVTIESQLPEDKGDPTFSRNMFKADVIITNVKRIEADEEKDIAEDYCELRCFFFNFAGAIFPATFTIRSKAGMEYFESLNISNSNPVFTQVWGPIQSKTIVIRKEEQSAFGEPSIKEVVRTSREWEVAKARPEHYEIGIDITAEEINDALKAREMHLAEVRAQNDAWVAARNIAPTAAPTAAKPAAPIMTGGFSF